MTVEEKIFGNLPEGAPVKIYTLANPGGITVKVMDYGATITEIDAPDRDGKMADVVLGFDSLAPYLTNSSYFGALVGRVGNRIAEACARDVVAILTGASVAYPVNRLELSRREDRTA